MFVLGMRRPFHSAKYFTVFGSVTRLCNGYLQPTNREFSWDPSYTRLEAGQRSRKYRKPGRSERDECALDIRCHDKFRLFPVSYQLWTQNLWLVNFPVFFSVLLKKCVSYSRQQLLFMSSPDRLWIRFPDQSNQVPISSASLKLY